MLELSSLGNWEPPIIMTIATDDFGADQLWESVLEHRSHLLESGDLAERRAQRIQAELEEIVSRSLDQLIGIVMERPEALELKSKMKSGEIDPYDAAKRLIDLAID